MSCLETGPLFGNRRLFSGAKDRPSETFRSESPKKMILLAGDGMEFEQAEATEMYAHGAPGALSPAGDPGVGVVLSLARVSAK
jgi:alkaline phosphatase